MVRSPGLLKEYYKNPQATAEVKDAQGWYHTGDAGFLDARGHLKIIDRAKDVGRLADGSMFAPKYIENKLKFSQHIKEAVDLAAGELLVGREVRVHLLDALLDEGVHLRLLREVGVARIGQVALLGPVAHRLEVDVDHDAHLLAPVADRDGFLDVREELELVLDVLRREDGAVGQAPDVLRAIDDLQVALRVEEAGIARVVPTLGILHCGGGLRVLVVLLEQPR